MSPVRSLAAALTAALLLCGGSLPTPAAPIQAKPDVAEDFKYLPADTNLLFVIQMDKLLASNGFKKLRKEIPLSDKEFEGGFSKQFGFEISNLERMTFGGPAKGNQPVGVFRLKSAVTVESIKNTRLEPRFEGDKRTTFKEEKVGTFTMYVPDQEYREAFCLLNDKTLLFCQAKELKAVLERDKMPDLSAGFRAAVKEGDLTAAVNMFLDLKAVAAAAGPVMIPGVDTKKIIESVSGVCLNIKVEGDNVSLRGVAVCTDAKAAEDIKKEAESILMLMTKFMKEAPKVPKDLVDLPGKVKLATQGNLGEATLTVKDDVVILFIKTWLMPRSPQPEPNPKPIKD